MSQGPVLLCGLCDISQHPYAHFHRRESFGAGFWQREAPSVIFSEDGAQAERGENCKGLLAVITLLLHLIAADLPVCRPALNMLSFLKACMCPSRCVLQLYPSHVQQLWRYTVEPTIGYDCAADLHFAWCAALRPPPHDCL